MEHILVFQLFHVDLMLNYFLILIPVSQFIGPPPLMKSLPIFFDGLFFRMPCQKHEQMHKSVERKQTIILDLTSLCLLDSLDVHIQIFLALGVHVGSHPPFGIFSRHQFVDRVWWLRIYLGPFL